MTDWTRSASLQELAEEVRRDNLPPLLARDALGLQNFWLASCAMAGDMTRAAVLVRDALPGWCWTMHGNGQAAVWPPGTVDEQNAGCIETEIEGDPARALLLAVILALTTVPPLCDEHDD